MSKMASGAPEGVWRSSSFAKKPMLDTRGARVRVS
jgi:hypothetical protein